MHQPRSLRSARAMKLGSLVLVLLSLSLIATIALLSAMYLFVGLPTSEAIVIRHDVEPRAAYASGCLLRGHALETFTARVRQS